MQPSPDPEVLIAGAGPTGLVLALWLARLGINIRIIDKNPYPAAHSRALAVQARTLEFYQQLGFAHELVDAGHRIAAANSWIAGLHVAHIPFGDLGRGLSPFPYVLIYPQDEHEPLLSATSPNSASTSSAPPSSSPSPNRPPPLTPPSPRVSAFPTARNRPAAALFSRDVMEPAPSFASRSTSVSPAASTHTSSTSPTSPPTALSPTANSTSRSTTPTSSPSFRSTTTAVSASSAPYATNRPSKRATTSPGMTSPSASSTGFPSTSRA